MLLFLLGCVVGATVGVVTMCLLSANGKDDEQ